MYKLHLEEYEITLPVEFESFHEAFMHGVRLGFRFSVWERDPQNGTYMYMGVCDGATMKWRDVQLEQRMGH